MYVIGVGYDEEGILVTKIMDPAFLLPLNPTASSRSPLAPSASLPCQSTERLH